MANSNFFGSLFEAPSSEVRLPSDVSLPTPEELKAGKSAPAPSAPTVQDVVQRATELGVDPRLALSFFKTESSGNFNSKDSSKGAVGGFQVMPGTYKQVMGTADGQRDPWNNMEAGLRYIAYGQKVLGTNDPQLLAAGYHAGYGRKELKEGRIPDTTDGLMSTKDYAAKVAKGAGKPIDQQAYRDLTPKEMEDFQKSQGVDMSIYREPTKTELEDFQSSQNSGFFGDLGKNLKIGLNTAAQDARELVGRIPYVGQPIVQGADAVDEYLSGKKSDELLKADTERMTRSQSPEMQAALGKQWWDSEKSTFGPAWTDWRSYAGGVTQSLPEQAITMIPAMRLAKSAYATKIAAGATEAVAAQAAARTAAIAGGVTEGALGGAQSAREVRDQVLNLKDDILDQSDAYKSLLDSGMNRDQAKSALAEDLATRAFVTSGVATGLFGGAGDRVIAKIITEKASKSFVKNLAKNAAKGVVGEGVLEELPQSVAQQLSQNEAIKQANPNKSLTDDVINQGLGGMALGGLQGGGMAATASGVQRRGAEPPAATAQPEAAVAPPAAPPSTVTPVPAQPSEAAGPMSRAMENAADQHAEQPTRAEVTTPSGRVSGVVESMDEDGQGGFQFKLLGDDGQTYTYTEKDGVQIAVEQKAPAGPMTAAVEKAAEEAPSTKPEAPSVAEHAPSTTAVEQSKPVEIAERTAPPAEAPLVLENMTDDELRARMKYIASQAKGNGGWDKLLMTERRKVEREINRRQEAIRDEKPVADAVRLPDVSAQSTPDATPAEPSKPARRKAVAESDRGGEAATGEAVAGAGTAVPGANAAADGQPALKDVAAGRWFGSQDKAGAFIAKNNLADSHEVVQTGKVRFEVKPKAVETVANQEPVKNETQVSNTVEPSNDAVSVVSAEASSTSQSAPDQEPVKKAPAADHAPAIDYSSRTDAQLANLAETANTPEKRAAAKTEIERRKSSTNQQGESNADQPVQQGNDGPELGKEQPAAEQTTDDPSGREVRREGQEAAAPVAEQQAEAKPEPAAEKPARKARSKKPASSESDSAAQQAAAPEQTAATPETPAAENELQSVFEGLASSKKKVKKAAEAKVAGHPKEAQIRFIEQNFYEILSDLDEAGLVKIDC